MKGFLNLDALAFVLRTAYRRRLRFAHRIPDDEDKALDLRDTYMRPALFSADSDKTA